MIFGQTIDTSKLEADIENGREALDALKGLSIEDAIQKIAASLVDFSFKVLIAILVFYVGRFIIRKIYTTTLKIMVRREVDASLATFVLSLIKMTLYFILIITIISILGLETSSFLAIFASAGVAIGMALSGTLQNFAGGVLILLLKPYKVGDYIETQGYSGTVKSIQLFSTVINTIDNKAIIIPNGGLSTGTINNYSLESYRRVDWTVGLSYGDDFDKAKETIMSMLLEDPRVVVKYIEDDEAAREKQARDEFCEEHPEECEEDSVNEKTENKGWWYRITHRAAKRNNMLKQALSGNGVDMNASIPQKLDRSPFVGLSQLADSSINITVRAWTHASNYWPLYFDMNRRFYKELPEKGFSFPFPQMDVHVSNN